MEEFWLDISKVSHSVLFQLARKFRNYKWFDDDYSCVVSDNIPSFYNVLVYENGHFSLTHSEWTKLKDIKEITMVDLLTSQTLYDKGESLPMLEDLVHGLINKIEPQGLMEQQQIHLQNYRMIKDYYNLIKSSVKVEDLEKEFEFGKRELSTSDEIKYTYEDFLGLELSDYGKEKFKKYLK